MTKEYRYFALAAVAFFGVLFCFDQTQEPGTQGGWAIGLGVCVGAFIQFVISAARADR